MLQRSLLPSLHPMHWRSGTGKGVTKLVSMESLPQSQDMSEEKKGRIHALSLQWKLAGAVWGMQTSQNQSEVRVFFQYI